MEVLRGLLVVCGAGLALAGTLGLAFLPVWAGLPTAMLLGAGAWLVSRQAGRVGRLAASEETERFEATVRRLAAENQGRVTLGALVAATGRSPAQVREELRPLTGRGICELELLPDGQTAYRLTPIDEVRAAWSTLSERNR